MSNVKAIELRELVIALISREITREAAELISKGQVQYAEEMEYLRYLKPNRLNKILEIKGTLLPIGNMLQNYKEAKYDISEMKHFIVISEVILVVLTRHSVGNPAYAALSVNEALRDGKYMTEFQESIKESFKLLEDDIKSRFEEELEESLEQFNERIINA